jgi:hypothetical protein
MWISRKGSGERAELAEQAADTGVKADREPPGSDVQLGER